MKGNLLIAQSGGPTTVINASLEGSIEQAMRCHQIDNIFGAKFGIEGVLKESFINFGTIKKETISMLKHTPASALGSCRRKLTNEDYPNILKCFEKHEIKYFLYIGGNDSMDTCNKVSILANDSNYDLKVIGIPKTMDNDLPHTDHSPGFGSAAKYAAHSALELYSDVKSLPIHVCILELMGRNAGWVTAASTLGKKGDHDGPHLVYLPERPFDENEFLEDVTNWNTRLKGGVLVVVSEGLVDKDKNPISNTGIVDGFGHTVPGGVGQYLSELIMKRLGIKSRSEKPGLLGRCCMALQSYVDLDEAYRAGAYAVNSAIQGHSGVMVSIKRLRNDPYQSTLELVPLEKVANLEKRFPDNWINKRGNGIEKDFYDYCLPLLGGNPPRFNSLTDVI